MSAGTATSRTLRSTASTTSSTVAAIRAGRRRRARRRVLVWTGLIVAVLAAYGASLVLGQTVYSPGEVARVIAGETVPGASFTVGELRLPRATMGLLAGFAFGIGGAVFQTMLRNPLASPDIIGVTWGASAAAVVGIVVLDLSETAVAGLATVAGLLTTVLIYGLSYKGGVAGTRLILIGIGFAAMLQSVVSYVISRAAEWDLQAAMQWLTGSLNNASWGSVGPLAVAFVLVVPVLIGCSRSLEVMRLGEETSSALGVPTERTRLILIVGATGLLAFATAAAGPIAFVAFLSGPIAARVLGPVGSSLVPAGLIGALLVLVGDHVAQYATETRYPVGVVTGVLGAPYLVYLLVRANRSGGTL